MASVTFVGILSELVPSGILPQLTEGLRISESEVGFLVGVHALASARIPSTIRGIRSATAT